MNIDAYSGGARLAEWVPYVQAAREEREQNLEAYIKDGQLYYRVVTDTQVRGCAVFKTRQLSLTTVKSFPFLPV